MSPAARAEPPTAPAAFLLLEDLHLCSLPLQNAPFCSSDGSHSFPAWSGKLAFRFSVPPFPHLPPSSKSLHLEGRGQGREDAQLHPAQVTLSVLSHSCILLHLSCRARQGDPVHCLSSLILTGCKKAAALLPVQINTCGHRTLTTEPGERSTALSAQKMLLSKQSSQCKMSK